jgi:hypothetical protein
LASVTPPELGSGSDPDQLERSTRPTKQPNHPAWASM